MQTIVNLGTGGADLNGQNGSTTSADSNDALFLDWTGDNYLYLPGLAGSSVSCTAPASVTQYKAYPTDGGATTDGAATGGASFSFSSEGSWARVDLLDGSSVVQASFDASAITSGAAVGQVDAYSVSWSINRSTSGRKAVAVVSPVWLFGTDDVIQVADNALLDFNATDSFTLVAIIRQWPTVPAFKEIITKKLGASPNDGYNMIMLNSDPSYYANIDDGPNTNPFVSEAYSYASVQVLATTVDRDTQTMIAYANATKAGADSDISAVGDISNSYSLGIGGRTNPTLGSFNDMELLGVAVFRRVLSVAEMQQIVTYYQNKAA